MANNITADEIITLKHKRNFIQFGGSKPSNIVRYSGQNAQYMVIEGLTVPEIGGIDPIWAPDPRRIGQYRLIGRSFTPADLPTASILMHEKHGAIPRQLGRIGCAFNMYELSGTCGDLSNFINGWSDYVLIYSGCVVTDKDLGTRSSWDSDDAIEDSLSVTMAAVYPVGPLGFGEQAGTSVDREIVGVTYGSKESCGDCGPSDDGSNRIYAVTKSSGAGSPGLPAELIYTLDGGSTFVQTSITGMGANEDPLAIAVVGTRLVILGASAYYWADLDSVTGAPGTFNKVVSGFVTAGVPRDIYVAGPQEVYFCGDAGYIYRSTDITAGVSVLPGSNSVTTANLTRIHGMDEVILAVGETGVVVKTTNRGLTWSLALTSPVTLNTISAVCVINDLVYWVGTRTNGRLFYTVDGAASWNEVKFNGYGSGDIWDIKFATPDVGYFSHSTTTPTAKIFSTWNGGADWTSSSPRIMNMPTFNSAKRIATPDVTDLLTASNNVALGGIASGGTDGILLVGTATKM